MSKKFVVGALIALAIGGIARAADQSANDQQQVVKVKSKTKKIVILVQNDEPVTDATMINTHKKTAKKVTAKKTAKAKTSKKSKTALQNPVGQKQKTVLTRPAPIVVAPVVVTPTTAQQVAIPPAQGRTSTPTALAVKEQEKSPFSIMWRSYNKEMLQGVENYPASSGGDKEVQVWERIYLGYNLNPDIIFQVVPMFWHTWFGDRDRTQGPSSPLGGTYTQPYDFYMDNTQFVVTDSKLAVLQGNIVVDAQLRYDAPTSEQSQLDGSPGEIWAAIGISRDFGKFNIALHEIPRWYLQQFNTSSVIDPSTVTPATPAGLRGQNKEIRFYTLLDMAYSFSKKFSISLESGFRNTVYYADPETNRAAIYRDEIVMQPEIDYTVTDNWTLGFGIWETPDMRNMPTPQYIPLYAENGGEAYLLSTLKF